jgi:pantoate kinase
MKTAKAFAPGHITGIFQIFDGPNDPMRKGSKGAGVCLTQGITTTVEVHQSSEPVSKILINGKHIDSSITSKRVLELFETRFPSLRDIGVEVHHDGMLPIGAGFGTSGAGALSLALALNEANDLGLSTMDAAQIAHRAEIECKTGLGTVIAETFGGVEIRVKPGAPGIGEIENITPPKNSVVACLTFGSLFTRDLLSNADTRRKINESSETLIKELREHPNVENLMKSSRLFAEQTGLITEPVREVLNATDKTNVVCSMPMFGESVFTLTIRRRLDAVLEIFEKHQGEGNIVLCDVDRRGATVIK